MPWMFEICGKMKNINPLFAISTIVNFISLYIYIHIYIYIHMYVYVYMCVPQRTNKYTYHSNVTSSNIRTRFNLYCREGIVLDCLCFMHSLMADVSDVDAGGSRDILMSWYLTLMWMGNYGDF